MPAPLNIRIAAGKAISRMPLEKSKQKAVRSPEDEQCLGSTSMETRLREPAASKKPPATRGLAHLFPVKHQNVSGLAFPG